MRSYPRNSPQAAARIVALAMLSDGHLARAELEVLAGANAQSRLGLRPAEFHEILHGLCDDLLSAAHARGADACRIDPQALASLMAEIDDQDLRGKVLDLCLEVIDADGEISEGESTVIAAILEHWISPHIAAKAPAADSAAGLGPTEPAYPPGSAPGAGP